MNYFPEVWIDTLDDLMNNGRFVSPRGKMTRELPQRTIEVDMRRPVLTVPARKLSYQFMAAEAYWILTGDDRVDSIAPYNKNISNFSDDGEKFFGAYGPKILDQLDYVAAKLVADPGSRQAGLTIWRENPPETKDVPCTVAIFFSIRGTQLNCHVFMRSSDAWLGVPYDVFNFSMLSHLVCCMVNTKTWELNANSTEERILYTPGTLYLTAASSHIYAEHFEAAQSPAIRKWEHQHPTPHQMFTKATVLYATLQHLRDSKPGDTIRWWEQVK